MMNQLNEKLLILINDSSSSNVELFDNIIVETERIITCLQYDEIKKNPENFSKTIFYVFFDFIGKSSDFDLDSSKVEKEIKYLLTIITQFAKIPYFSTFFIHDLSIYDFITNFFNENSYEYVPLLLSITKNVFSSIAVDSSDLENIIPIDFFAQFFHEELPNCQDEKLISQICKYIVMILLFYIKNELLDPNNLSLDILLNIPKFAQNDDVVVLFMAICYSQLIQKNKITEDEQFEQINSFLEENLFKIDYEKKTDLTEKESTLIIQLINLYIELSKQGHSNNYDVSLPLSILSIADNQELSDKCLDFLEAIVLNRNDEEKYRFLSYFITHFNELNAFQKNQVSLIVGDIILTLNEMKDDLISPDIFSILVSVFENIEEKDSLDQSKALFKLFEYCQKSGMQEIFVSIMDDYHLFDIISDFCDQNSNEAEEILNSILSQIQGES